MSRRSLENWRSLFISPSECRSSEALCGFRLALLVQRREKGQRICAHGFWRMDEVRLSTRKGPLVRGVPRPLRRSRSNRAYCRMASLPRLAVCSGKVRGMSLPALQGRPKPPCSIQSSIAFSLSAMQSLWKNTGTKSSGRASRKGDQCLCGRKIDSRDHRTIFLGTKMEAFRDEQSWTFRPATI